MLHDVSSGFLQQYLILCYIFVSSFVFLSQTRFLFHKTGIKNIQLHYKFQYERIFLNEHRNYSFQTFSNAPYNFPNFTTHFSTFQWVLFYFILFTEYYRFITFREYRHSSNVETIWNVYRSNKIIVMIWKWWRYRVNSESITQSKREALHRNFRHFCPWNNFVWGKLYYYRCYKHYQMMMEYERGISEANLNI